MSTESTTLALTVDDGQNSKLTLTNVSTYGINSEAFQIQNSLEKEENLANSTKTIQNFESFVEALTHLSRKNRKIRDFVQLRTLIVQTFGADESTMTDEQFKTRVELARFNLNLRPKEIEVVSLIRDIDPIVHIPRENKTPKKDRVPKERLPSNKQKKKVNEDPNKANEVTKTAQKSKKQLFPSHQMGYVPPEMLVQDELQFCGQVPIQNNIKDVPLGTMNPNYGQQRYTSSGSRGGYQSTKQSRQDLVENYHQVNASEQVEYRPQRQYQQRQYQGTNPHRQYYGANLQRQYQGTNQQVQYYGENQQEQTSYQSTQEEGKLQKFPRNNRNKRQLTDTSSVANSFLSN